jgi:ATP-dependent DNA helicase RecQ
MEYILEVARAGFEVNWVRFCKETGLTDKIAKEIQVGISKAGSKEKLKLIKEQVPEFVSSLSLWR